jgi:predicted nucleic acid-binding protein
MALTRPVFLDSNVFIRGLTLPPDGPGPLDLLKRLADEKNADCHTAWHCCLEFYAVTTRLPVEYRLRQDDALSLLETQILGRFTVHGLHDSSFRATIQDAARERIAGGRMYDAHIAAVARQAGARLFITENPRHFAQLERHGIAVRTSRAALAAIPGNPR